MNRSTTLSMQTRIVLSLLLLSLLSGCGFHLRGSPGAATSRLHSVYIRSAYSGTILAEIRAQLQQAGVELSPGPEQAQLVLALEGENYQRSVLSVSPRTGKVEEYQLTLEVYMSVADTDGTVVLGSTRVAAARDYAFDQDSVLGEFTEENTLREDLSRRVATRIIRRLDAAAGR